MSVLLHDQEIRLELSDISNEHISKQNQKLQYSCSNNNSWNNIRQNIWNIAPVSR